jgi:hypothetical protein
MYDKFQGAQFRNVIMIRDSGKMDQYGQYDIVINLNYDHLKCSDFVTTGGTYITIRYIYIYMQCIYIYICMYTYRYTYVYHV